MICPGVEGGCKLAIQAKIFDLRLVVDKDNEQCAVNLFFAAKLNVAYIIFYILQEFGKFLGTLTPVPHYVLHF